jgi:hypothetical protein
VVTATRQRLRLSLLDRRRRIDDHRKLAVGTWGESNAKLIGT